jgi:WD40 repeat protein
MSWRLAVRPTSISSDWQYYATYNSVGRGETGKPLFSLGDRVYAVHAFSPDSRYVAESSGGKATLDSHIRVVELATGTQVSAFENDDAFSLALSPDGVTLASSHWDAIILWNMLTGKRLAGLRGFGRYVKGLSFSKTGPCSPQALILEIFESGMYPVERSSFPSTLEGAKCLCRRSGRMAGQ